MTSIFLLITIRMNHFFTCSENTAVGLLLRAPVTVLEYIDETSDIKDRIKIAERRPIKFTYYSHWIQKSTPTKDCVHIYCIYCI